MSLMSLRRNLPALVFGTLTAFLLGWACLLCAGCQSTKTDADILNGHFTALDVAFNDCDGTATALENGAVQPKAAAKTIHKAVKAGKKASAAASDLSEGLVERAEKAEAALASRGRLWMERGLFGAGAVCWALAGWQLWTLLGVLGLVAAAPGAALVAGAVSAVSGREPSVIRRVGFILCAFAMGCAFFWALVKLDEILFIGKCTAGVVALIGAGALYLHTRKKAKKASVRAQIERARADDADDKVAAAEKVVQAVDEAKKIPAVAAAFKDPAAVAILNTMGEDGKAFVNAAQGR